MKRSRVIGALCTSFFSLCICMSPANAAPVSGQGTWETTLEARDLDGNTATIEAYYDTVLEITWLADAHPVENNTFGLATDTNLGPYPGDPSGYDGYIYELIDPGEVNWPGGKFWIDAMNDANYLGNSGWQIPTVADMSSIYNDTLGNIPANDLANTGPFTNLQWAAYWSSTEYALDASMAWFFVFDLSGDNLGFEAYDNKSYGFSVWAVHDGDIGVSTVPIPAAIWLFGSGLLGLVGMASRKKTA